MVFLEKEKLDIVNAALKNKLPILMIGETGVGKTTIAAAIAKSKGKKLVRLSLNGNIGTEELLGKFVLENGATKWIDGPLVEALRKGYHVVLDELNSALPEVLFSLHALLDHERAVVLQEKDGERVKAHSDFRLWATINPVSYAGTRNLNAAFMSRFIIIDIKPLEPVQERKLLIEKTKADDKVLDLLLNLSTELRQKKKEGLIEYFCSTRDLEQAAALTMEGVPTNQAVVYAIINKMSQDDINTITESSKTLAKFLDTIQAMPLGEQIRRFEEIKKQAEVAKNEIKVANESVKTITTSLSAKQTELKSIDGEIVSKKKELQGYVTLATEERMAIAREYIQKHL